MASKPSDDDSRPVERRRPRREAEVTYRFRADLQDINPPVWRRLEVSSHLFLDELHVVLQTVVGWTDSHLHMFALGSSAWEREAQRFLCQIDVEEGDDENPIAEQDVRLDEVLVEPGDRLLYVYDYGDGWEHVLRLEAVVEGAPDVRARCTDGRRAGPPEDCGGPRGYQELVDAGEVDDALDLAAVNASLSIVAAAAGAAPASLGAAAEMARRLRGTVVGLKLDQLLREAKLAEPVEVDPAEAAAMVERYRWLLDVVGEDGVRLTSAGYLPPRVVEAAFRGLGLGDEWVGSGNRESHTRPVLTLRESAQRTGLLRKRRGQLLLTDAGRRLRNEPVELWRHLATRLLPRDTDTFPAQATLVTLVGVAAGQDIDAFEFEGLAIDVLGNLGWRHSDGEPLHEYDVMEGARDTLDVLDHMQGFTGEQSWHRGTPTPSGRATARTALRG